jgi:hypothetical protein
MQAGLHSRGAGPAGRRPLTPWVSNGAHRRGCGCYGVRLLYHWTRAELVVQGGPRAAWVAPARDHAAPRRGLPRSLAHSRQRCSLPCEGFSPPSSPSRCGAFDACGTQSTTLTLSFPGVSVQDHRARSEETSGPEGRACPRTSPRAHCGLSRRTAGRVSITPAATCGARLAVPGWRRAVRALPLCAAI